MFECLNFQKKNLASAGNLKRLGISTVLFKQLVGLNKELGFNPGHSNTAAAFSMLYRCWNVNPPYVLLVNDSAGARLMPCNATSQLENEFLDSHGKQTPLRQSTQAYDINVVKLIITGRTTFNAALRLRVTGPEGTE